MNLDNYPEGRVTRGPDLGNSQSSSLRTWISRVFSQIFAGMRPPRFVKYRPAVRLGTRRLETRLLRRLAWRAAETVQ